MPDLEISILDVLAATGKDPDRLAPEDLSGVDEFHVRGRKATEELACALEPASGTRVLDVGCGLGGAARHLAKQYGCRVTGLDLNPAYCRAAEALTRRLGLDPLVSFVSGDATDLPFPDRYFDIVWTQHVAMAIADKERLYREFRRVLRPGGRLAIYDVVQGPGGEVHFPVPWAREPSASFLVTPEGLRELLEKGGFEAVTWRDVTEEGRRWFCQLRERIKKTGLPPLGLQLLLGKEFAMMSKNQALNLEEGRIALVQAVLRRPPGT